MKFIQEYFKKNTLEFIFLIAILLIALTLRIIAINNYGALYHDENYSWYFASLNSCFDTLKELIKIDIHMPLYFVILHFWTKIFSQSPESLHYCSVFLSIFTIPFAFYLIKKHFNIYAAYFASILLTLNTFFIYYGVYVRFYALAFPLSLLFAFSFLKFIEKPDNKNAILFIIIHSLLFYTFHISAIMSFFYALYGLIYILFNKKDIKRFLISYLIIGLISLPGIIFILNNLIILSTNLCSHSKEFFNFSWYAIYDILENKEFIKLDTIKHHGLSRLDHSIKVSYYSYKIAKKLKFDYKSIARAGLLHDFFITSENFKIKERAKSFYMHPKYSLENSSKYFELNDLEKNIIESHMFPMYIKVPKYKESWIVSSIDKVVATHEFLKTFSTKVSYITNIFILIVMNNLK